MTKTLSEAELVAELVEAKRERDEARGIMPSKVWNEIFEAPANFLTGHRKHYYANYQIVREAHQRAKEQCPLAADVIMAQAFFQAVASEREEIAWKEVLDERARAEAAEASLAAAKERLATLRNEVLEEAAKIADDWLEQWVDVKISHVPPHAYAADAIRDLRDGIRALKTAGKE